MEKSPRLSDLSPELKAYSIKLIKEFNNEEDSKCKINDNVDVMSFFIWSKTEEGSGFWNELYTKGEDFVKNEYSKEYNRIISEYSNLTTSNNIIYEIY